MADSACFNQWRKYTNSKGKARWVNEGPAPEGACPSCPDMAPPVDGKWDGASAACSGGAIYQRLSNGVGGLKFGEMILPASSPAAKQACNGDYYIGTGPIQNYFL